MPEFAIVASVRFCQHVSLDDPLLNKLEALLLKKSPPIQLLHNSPLSWRCHDIVIFTTQRLKGHEMPLKSFRMAKLLVYSTHAHTSASEGFLESRIALSLESKGVWNRVENLLHTQLEEGICRDVVFREGSQEFLWRQGKNPFRI